MDEFLTEPDGLKGTLFMAEGPVKVPVEVQ